MAAEISGFLSFAIILAIAAVISVITRVLRQPLIVGYIVTGIIISPYILGLVYNHSQVQLFAQIGVAILLFMVGLGLNPKIIKEVGVISTFTGVGQVLFTCVIGFFMLRLTGLSAIESVYVAVGLSFSSTIIIMKLLSDKGELDTLYGKISVGFLIIQDLIAMIILMAISATSSETNALGIGTIIYGIAAIFVMYLISIFILPKFMDFVARTQELLFLFIISWCLFCSVIIYNLGFSYEIGALAAGMTLAISPYAQTIGAKVRPIRDFFIIVFFILLGSQLTFNNISAYILPIVLSSILVLVGNPIIVMTIMGLMGYTKRTGFMSGLAVAQISEFSIIVLSLGVSVGHVSEDILSAITIVALITIAGSAYMIMHSERLYEFFKKYLSIFEKQNLVENESFDGQDNNYDVVLVGCDKLGYDILKTLEQSNYRFTVVDHNPRTIRSLRIKEIDTIYGDINDIDLLEDINVEKIKMIISTIPNYETNLMLLEHIKSRNKDAIIILTSRDIERTLDLYKRGATYIIQPEVTSSKATSELIDSIKFDKKEYETLKDEDVDYLKDRIKKRLDYNW